MYIPALFMDPGVRKGYTLPLYISNKDFAPTALNAYDLFVSDSSLEYSNDSDTSNYIIINVPNVFTNFTQSSNT